MFSKIKNYIIPQKYNNKLTMYQRIIVFGGWLIIICVIASVLIEVFCNDYKKLELFKQYLIGISCSTVVALLTSLFQFLQTRKKLFDSFYLKVFDVLYAFEKTLGESDLVEKEKLNKKYKYISDTIDECNEYASDLFWFSKEKQEACLLVRSNILKIWSLTYGIMDNNDDKNIASDNRRIIESIADGMIVLNENSHPDNVNVFKMLRKSNQEEGSKPNE